MFTTILAAQSVPQPLELVDIRIPQKDYPCLGMDLFKERTIMFRGKVSDIRGLSGGLVYVDGNVEEMVACRGGLVYINGDLKKIDKQNENTLVVVVGELGVQNEPQTDIKNGLVLASRAKLESAIVRDDLEGWKVEEVHVNADQILESILRERRDQFRVAKTSYEETSWRVSSVRRSLPQL